MAYDMFFDIDGIPGESPDAKYKDKISVFGFTWGAEQTGSASYGTTQSTGKVDVRKLRFTKRTDASSHLLFINCCTGAHIKQATLIVRKQGGEPLDFLKILLTDVVVHGFELVGTSDDGASAHPDEVVTLGFSTVKFSYAKQKDNRTLEAPKEVTWSLTENRKV